LQLRAEGGQSGEVLLFLAGLVLAGLRLPGAEPVVGGLPSRPEGRRLGEGGPPGPLRLESAPARARGGEVIAADQPLRLGADRFQLGAARPSREERLVALPCPLGRGLEAPREGLGFGSRNGLEGGPGRPGPLERAGDRLALRLLRPRAQRLRLLPP